MDVIEADGGSRHACLLQCGHDFLTDGRFLAGHALDRQEAHQPIDGGGNVELEGGGHGSGSKIGSEVKCQNTTYES